MIKGFMLYVRYNVEGCMNHVKRIHKNNKIPTYKDIEMYTIPIANFAIDRYDNPMDILNDISSISSFETLSDEHQKWMRDIIIKRIKESSKND